MTGIPKSDEVRAFSYWLRTGRRLPVGNPGGVEVKFNPWHDPANGQFTFTNSGDYHGLRGGGGSFGGGGASGSWSGPNAVRRQEKRPPVVARPGLSIKPPTKTPVVPAATTVQQPSESFRHIIRNGYDYAIDRSGRTRRVSGPITLANHPRSRSAQAAAGGADRRPTDDGGHYIAARFNGPSDAFNHFVQDSNFNRSEYRLLENQWARAKRSGMSVAVAITPKFVGDSQRPDQIDVIFWINGNRESLKLTNAKQDKPHAKQ